VARLANSLFRNYQNTEAIRKLKKIIVVGSGVCGLTAAYRLKQLGYHPVVLEKAERLGGRTKTDSTDGFVLDLGGTYLATTYKEAFQLLDELGLQAMQEPSQVTASLYIKGQFRKLDNTLLGFLRFPYISWRSKLSLMRLIFPVIRNRGKLNLVNLSSCAELDTETAEAFCRRTVTPEAYDLLINMFTRYMFGHDCSEISVVELLWILKIYATSDVIALKGGVQTLTHALARDLDVRTGHDVQRVQATKDGIVASALTLNGNIEITADYCVIASDGKDLQRIYGHALSGAQQHFLTELRYNPYWVPNFKFKQRPPVDSLMAFLPSSENPDVSGFYWYHLWGNTKVPADKGLLQLIPTNHWNFRMEEMSSQEYCLTQARLHVYKYFPFLEQYDSTSEVTPWSRATIIARPGHYKRLEAFVADIDRSSRVQYGGDYMSQSSIGTAVATGTDLAKRMVAAI
jgi:protoporphyrinogen oxidase